MSTASVYARAAPYYLAAGWASPLWLPQGAKFPPPVGLTGAQASEPTPEDVAAWSAKPGNGNIALRMPDDVIGIDVDAHSGKPGGDTIASLEADLGPLPATWRSSSREGDEVSGIRLYRVPAGLSWRDAGPGVETIWRGHRYAVVSPSVHAGRTYHWYAPDGTRARRPPEATEIAELPQTWVEYLTKPRGAQEPAQGQQRPSEPVGVAQNPAWVQSAVRQELTRLRAMSEAATPGGHGYAGEPWDQTTYDVACRLFELAATGQGGDLDPEAAVFDRAPRDAGFTDIDVRKCIASAREKVQGKVAAVPPPKADISWVDDVPSSPSRPATQKAPTGTLTEAHRGQVRMAYRLAARYAGSLLYVNGIGWHHYDGTRWVEDIRGVARRAVLDVLHEAIIESSTGDKDLRADASKCESDGGINGTLGVASSLGEFAVAAEDLDVDPYVVNCANGTLDLRTMHMTPHGPGDRLARCTRGAYRSDTDTAAWDAFLARILPDEAERAYLQRVVGQSLVGQVGAHIFPILTGEGANGKGTFYGAVLHSFGSYGTVIDPSLLMAQRGDRTGGPELMRLRGARLVVGSETGEGRALDTATMKRLTGGDALTARNLYQPPVTWTPTHQLLYVTNHLPTVAGDDPAVWRRMRVIPFDVVIPAAERDDELGRTLELHADAVLSWAVQGYVSWKAGGLAAPDSVRVATDAYASDSDPIARFIEEQCVVGPRESVAFGVLWDRFRQWHDDERDGSAIGRKTFGAALDRRGYRSYKDNGSARTVMRRGLTVSVLPR